MSALRELALNAYDAMVVAGPLPAVAAVVGAAVVGTSILPRADSAADLLVLLGIVLVLIGAVEWAIARRFAAHEKAEATSQSTMLDSQRQAFSILLESLARDLRGEMQRMTLLFDAQGAVYEGAKGVANVLSERVNHLRTEIDSLDARLKEVEKFVLAEREDISVAGARRRGV